MSHIRVAGIDPGTRSFDIVLLEDDVVRGEASLNTELVAREPQRLINILDNMSVDYIVAPSGYGVPVTSGAEIREARRFAVEVLLLSDEESIAEGVKAGEAGVWVYSALANIVEHLIKNYGGKALFLPAVINLRSVPRHRKVNKVDMGTVDKLASTFLAIHETSEKESIDYEDVNIIVAELGYGYAASIAVKQGKIVDGVGGTYASTGTLTSGALDAELVAGVGNWKRWDIFHGGILEALGAANMEDIVKGYEKGEEPHKSYLEAYIEGVAKDVKRALTSTPKARTLIITGRHGKNETITKRLKELLPELDIRNLKGLKGASKSKEAAQGYAAIGEGIVGTYFKRLVEHMGIKEACGTAVDYIVHPRAKSFVERVRRAYIETMSSLKLCEDS